MSVSSSSASSATPHGITNRYHQRMANIVKNPVYVLSLDFSLASQELSVSNTTDSESHTDLNAFQTRDMPFSGNVKCGESEDSAINEEANSEYASGKFKRSLSISNDVSYERDRFRARFRTFNTNSPVVSEEEHAITSGTNIGVGISANKYPSQKTKKLNVTAPCPTEAILDVLSNYSIKEPISPLNQESTFFKLNIIELNMRESGSFELYSITVSQLANVFHWYYNNPLPPTTRMFPWLHGLHSENYAQKTFFARQDDLDKLTNDPSTSIADLDLDVRKPEDVRFLMCVESTGAICELTKVIRNTVKTEEILCRIQYSRQMVRQEISELMSVLKSLEQNTCEDWTETTNQIFLDCLFTGFMPEFTDRDPRSGVSLRNFHIQASKTARCTDFVVYCLTDKHEQQKCKCLALSRLLRVAQVLEERGRQSQYNVFVMEPRAISDDADTDDVMTVRDNAAVFAGLDHTKKTQLLLYSMLLLKTETFRAWDADYFVKEKVETTRMSAALRLHLNVWAGNIWDQQTMMYILSSKGPETEADPRLHINPVGDSRFQYCDPLNSSLIKDKSFSVGTTLVSMLPLPKARWQLFVLCHNEAQFPTAQQVQELLFKYTIALHRASEVAEFHQLEFPSSGSIGLGDCKQASLMSFVNTCKLIYLYSSSMTEDGLSALVYCSDGYTELSLLVLSYLMYAKDIPLEEAILALHNKYGRPFYLFASDVNVLRKVEPLVRKYSPHRLGADGIVWSKAETITNAELNDILLGRAREQPAPRSIPRRLRLGYIANDLDLSSSETEDEELDTDETHRERNWVEEIEGSLPSRILTYLYLGLLRHANNTTVLSKLGISKVVSVGETVDWIYGLKLNDSHDVSLECYEDDKIHMYSITPKTEPKLTKYLHLSVDTIMKVNSLLDDGIDELSRVLLKILKFIDEQHRKSNGNVKILVHCRVGVSRSASVVIAEVMRRYGLNLPQAYLFVRVRRLNIVIQPNLKFMYELFKWEERERAQKRDKSHEREDLRVIDWFVMCQEIKKLNNPFVSTG